MVSSIRREFLTPAWKRSLFVWVAFNILFICLGVVHQQIWGPIRPRFTEGEWSPASIDLNWNGGLLGVWVRWDAEHYVRITEEGYSSDLVSAFFPLYPLMGRWTGIIFNTTSVVGLLIISRLALYFLLVLLYKITSDYFNDTIATYSLISLCLFPTAFFLLAPYPLSLALLFTLLSLRGALKKQWLIAALAGLAAGLTDGKTVPLILALFTIWLNQVRSSPRAGFLLPATGSSMLGTALFLSWRFSNGFPDYAALQNEYWSRVFQPPWMIVNDFWQFFSRYAYQESGWVNIMLLLFAVGMTTISLRKLPSALKVYQIGFLLFLFSTSDYKTPFLGVGRYLLLAFPLFVATALTLSGKWTRLAAISIGFFASVFLTMAYFHWLGIC